MNLPTPVPQRTINDKCVYVRITDVIANMLASGTPVDQFDKDSCTGNLEMNTNEDDLQPGLSTTKCAYDLFEKLNNNDEEDEQTLFLWIKE